MFLVVLCYCIDHALRSFGTYSFPALFLLFILLYSIYMCSLWTTCGVLFFPWAPSLFFNILHTLCRCYRQQFIFFVLWSGKSDHARPGVGRTCRRFSFFFSQFNAFCLVSSRQLRILSTPVLFVPSLNAHFPTFSSTDTSSRLFDFQ